MQAQPNNRGFLAAAYGAALQLREGGRWPFSIKILVAVALLYLLQMFPYTGIFLMLVAAPFWSVPLVNLAVIVAGIEGLLGRAPRWFLLVPVCWFGFYEIAVLREHAALATVKVDVAATNAAAVPIAYDPARHDILSKTFQRDLVLRRRLAVVYSEQGRGRNRRTRSMRLGTGPLCETLEKRKLGLAVTVWKVHPSTAKRYGLSQQQPHCLVSFDEEPERQMIRLERNRLRGTVDGLSARRTVFYAEIGDQRAEVEKVSAALLASFPMPTIGCFLNSGAPSWDCFARFMRNSREQFGFDGDDRDAISRVLDTTRAIVPVPGQTANAEIMARLAVADQRRDRALGQKIMAFLRDPKANRLDYKVRRQYQREPEKLSPFTGDLLSGLETAAAQERQVGRKAGNNALSIARVVALLPDVEIQRNGDRILALLDGPPRGWQRRASPLIRRLSALGEKALPLLHARVKPPYSRLRMPTSRLDAIIALCRMGLPVAATAGPDLAELWRWRNNPKRLMRRSGRSDRPQAQPKLRLLREDRYLYLALLRLGLRKEAEQSSLTGNSAWWRKALQTVSSNSSAAICEQVR